jgi:hypothetical protein
LSDADFASGRGSALKCARRTRSSWWAIDGIEGVQHYVNEKICRAVAENGFLVECLHAVQCRPRLLAFEQTVNLICNCNFKRLASQFFWIFWMTHLKNRKRPIQTRIIWVS